MRTPSIFYYKKVNWIERNRALCGVNFFNSHFVNISLTTLFSPATGSRPFLCKPGVPTLSWNCMKTEPAEERKSHSSECMEGVSMCLGEPPEAASAILTPALFLELSKSLVGSGYLTRWKQTFHPWNSGVLIALKVSWVLHEQLLSSSTSHQTGHRLPPAYGIHKTAYISHHCCGVSQTEVLSWILLKWKVSDINKVHSW